MKLVEYAIYEKIKNLVSGKVYAMRAPDGETDDFIVFQRTDSQRWRSINSPSGIAQAFIRIDSYSQSYYRAKENALLVEGILDGFAGIVGYGGNSPQDTVNIGGISLQNDVDLFDQTDEPFLYRSSLSFLVTYEQE